MTETLSTTEAVRIFRCHPATILRLILMQRVSAEKDRDGRWRISRTDLENWNRNRRKRTYQ